MTTPYDPYGSATSALPSATQNQIPGNALGINSATINTSDMNVSSSGGGVIAGYAGSPGPGNLAFSLSVVSGTDAFGNTINTGINAISGSLQGTTLVGVQMDSSSTLQNTQINSPQVLTPTINGGTAATLTQTMTNTQGGVLGYTSGSTSVTFSTNGNYSFTVPTGITSLNIQCWGAGGGGGGGNSSQGGESGGGGEFAQEPSFAVSPGQVYSIIVGQGGSGGSTGFAGGNGSATVFQSQSGGGTSVTANPGLAGSGFVHGAGGSGSSNSVHFDGGNGADSSGNTGGAGGGGSAGPNAQGNGGNQSVSSSGAVGGAGFAGAGAGGSGGNSASNGSNGSSPGGAGGGAGANSITNGSKTYGVQSGTYSYRGSDATQNPNALINHDGPMYQGYPGGGYGTQYSYFGLPYATIESDLAGLTVTAVQIKLKCLYSYFNQVYPRLYYTNLTFWGSTGNGTSGSPVFVRQFTMGENEIVQQNLGLDGGIGVALQNGNAKSMEFYSLGFTPGGDYYGSFDSGANNGYQPGIIVYYNNGGGSTAGNGSDGQVVISYGNSSTPTFTLSVSATTSADTFGNPYNAGFTGGQVTLTGSQAPSTTPTSISNTVSSSAAIAANTSGQVITTNTSGFTGQMASNQSDITAFTISSTAPTQASKAFSIPAGDPQVGTIYRLSTWGDVSNTGTTSTITWTCVAFGGTFASITWGAAPQTVGTYSWFLQSYFQILTTGSGGSAQNWLTGTFNEFNVNLGNVDTGGSLTAGEKAGTPVINTTAAGNTIEFTTKLGAVITGFVMHSYGSLLERLGP